MRESGEGRRRGGEEEREEGRGAEWREWGREREEGKRRKRAKPDFTIGSKEYIDLHGGALVHVASKERPQSALSATRRGPPEPMSLGVKTKSTGDRGPARLKSRKARRREEKREREREGR